jgi:superfamily II DNA or RNA helicase
VIKIEGGNAIIETPRAEELAPHIDGASAQGNVLTVPITHDTAHQCIMFGLPYVHPIMLEPTSAFRGPWPPAQHQYGMMNFVASARRGYLLADMGTMKTATAVWACEYLRRINVVNKILVVAPLTILEDTWGRALFECATGTTYTIGHGRTPAIKNKLLSEPTPWHITNFDTVVTQNPKLLANAYDCIIVDESRTYADKSTDRWKALNKVARNVPYVIGMTGAATPQGPMDAYGQAKLITPATMPYTKREWQNLTMDEVRKFKFIPKVTAAAEVARVLFPAYVVVKREVLKDLPPLTHEYEKVPLSEQQQEAYRILQKHSMLEFAGGTVTPANAAVKWSKILQIASGCLYDDAQHAWEFDATPRIEAAKKWAASAASGTLIFASYTHTIRMLAREFVPMGFAVINGEVSPRERSRILSAFAEGQYKGIIAEPSSMSHGVNAQTADVTVWYSPARSTDVYIQASNRMDRPGQKNPMTMVHLYSTPTEKERYHQIANNLANQENTFKLFERFINE